MSALRRDSTCRALEAATGITDVSGVERISQRIWIGGFPVLDTTAVQLVRLLNQRLARRQRTELYFANTNFVLGCRGDRSAFRTPETLIVNDGIGLELACRLLHGRGFAENLNGTDFTPLLLRNLDAPARVFLLGSTAEVVCSTAAAWTNEPHLRIVGTVDGFEGVADDVALVERIALARPDILLVALGNPRQEEWIVVHRSRIDVPLVMGVGALFDFVSGRTRRAPRVMQRLRLEWLYRLVLEPRRLVKRYTVDIVSFFGHCLRTRHEDASSRS